jgi:hypothetical protein
MARAFDDDLPLVWMLPELRTRHVRARRLFATILRAGALGHGGSRSPSTAARSSAMRSGFRPGTGIRPQSGNCGPRLGTSVPSAVASTRPPRLRRRPPARTTRYLYAIGAEPARRGQASRAVCCDPDCAGTTWRASPPTLSPSRRPASPLYEHFGFRAAGTPALPADAPVITAMWRSPAGSHA